MHNDGVHIKYTPSTTVQRKTRTRLDPLSIPQSRGKNVKTFRWDHTLRISIKTGCSPMVLIVTLGQQYNVEEKPIVILYTYINHHAGTPDKHQKQKQCSALSNIVVVASRVSLEFIESRNHRVPTMAFTTVESPPAQGLSEVLKVVPVADAALFSGVNADQIVFCVPLFRRVIMYVVMDVCDTESVKNLE